MYIDRYDIIIYYINVNTERDFGSGGQIEMANFPRDTCNGRKYGDG